MNRLILPLVVCIAAALLAWWVWHNGSPADEILLGGYIEAEQIQVGSRLAGRVTRVGTLEIVEGSKARVVAIDEGVSVEAGQVLVEFETDEVEAQLSEAQADRELARARLSELQDVETQEAVRDKARAKVKQLTEKSRMMEFGPRLEDIQQARKRYQRSKAEAENAQSNYDRVMKLYEQKATAQETAESARKLLEMANSAMEADKLEAEKLERGYRDEEKAMARHELEEAEAARRLAERSPLPQEIEQAQAAVDAADARIRRLQVLEQEGTVRAPLPSVVESFDLQPGDMVAPGAPLATLVRKDELWVRAFVPETELGLLSDNQNVQVTVDSFPGRRFSGTILRINRVGEFTPRNVQTYKERQDMMFGIKVRVHDDEHLLRPGMAATVHVPRKRPGQ